MVLLFPEGEVRGREPPPETRAGRRPLGTGSGRVSRTSFFFFFLPLPLISVHVIVTL